MTVARGIVRMFSTWRSRGRTLAAAAMVLVAAVTLFNRPRDAKATSPHSELIVTPARPRAGDTVRVRYRPPAGMFGEAKSVVLRARLRTPLDRMYTVPAHQVRVVATLRRTASAAHEGSFTLPDSFVFASLAVEDAAVTRVDDNDGRLWEVLVHSPDGRPTYEALEQRVNDMMGRSWEEGYATARRLTELYPDRVGSWAMREFFERALLGEAGGDSVAAAYRPRVDSLVRAAKNRDALSYGDIGTIFWRMWTGAQQSSADSVEAEYWWRRIGEEHPRHEQVAQRLAIDLGQRFPKQPAVLLDTLERLYPALVPIQGPGGHVFNTALRAANELGDDVAYRRWLGRSLSGAPDSASSMALALATRPATRREGMTALRAQVNAPAAKLATTRGLTETKAEYERRAEKVRRRMLATLGRALVAEGQTRAGLDTLALAGRGVWDVALFRDVAAAYLAAGDSAGASAMHARLAVDPRTPSTSADSLARAGRARLGATRWDSATTAARREMHARLIELSLSRPMRGTPRLRDAAGRSYALRELTGGEPAVVIFWSRHCGAAISALPSIADAIVRLRRGGTPVVFVVVDEPPSRELAEYLAKQKVTWPVYHDDGGATRTAFANFGTPGYRVLDAAGRIRFDYVESAAELIARVGALQSEKR